MWLLLTVAGWFAVAMRTHSLYNTQTSLCSSSPRVGVAVLVEEGERSGKGGMAAVGHVEGEVRMSVGEPDEMGEVTGTRLELVGAVRGWDDSMEAKG